MFAVSAVYNGENSKRKLENVIIAKKNEQVVATKLLKAV